jgi:hypothetical protein
LRRALRTRGSGDSQKLAVVWSTASTWARFTPRRLGVQPYPGPGRKRLLDCFRFVGILHPSDHRLDFGIQLGEGGNCRRREVLGSRRSREGTARSESVAPIAWFSSHCAKCQGSRIDHHHDSVAIESREYAADESNTLKL